MVFIKTTHHVANLQKKKMTNIKFANETKEIEINYIYDVGHLKRNKSLLFNESS